MLKCASIHTFEIDDFDIALEQLNTQLAEKLTLLDNTIGVLMCHPEYITSGAVKHIADNLPFELAGATTSVQAVNDDIGELMLTIFVMTSDDIRFRAGVTGNLDDGIQQPTKAAYDIASAGENEAPALALIFPPLLLNYSGDEYVYAWESIIPGVPLFGTLAIEDTIPFDDSETIYKGDSFKAAMSFILCYGNINPRFYIATLEKEKAMPYKGEITKSNGAYVLEINNTNAYKYFSDIGFASNGVLADGYGFVLYVIDQKMRDDYDGVPVVRGLVAFTEDGAAIFRGDMDEGSTFSMLTSDCDDVLTTTRNKVAQMNDISEINGILMFPCIIRRMVAMSVGPLTELETIQNTIDPAIPYMAAYAGGEICPTSVVDGKPTNRFHNYSLVMMVV
ncbi:MAG: FIST C-terminal domain-containing protein [Oscillospiraceae bacterium]|nr:FIST C-terminal domain-containing protein [Oscillospiraceae bacterium]